jgi:hypothetical protein
MDKKIKNIRFETGFIIFILSLIIWLGMYVIVNSFEYGNTLFGIQAKENPPDFTTLFILLFVLNICIVLAMLWIMKFRIEKQKKKLK